MSPPITYHIKLSPSYHVHIIPYDQAFPILSNHSITPSCAGRIRMCYLIKMSSSYRTMTLSNCPYPIIVYLINLSLQLYRFIMYHIEHSDMYVGVKRLALRHIVSSCIILKVQFLIFMYESREGLSYHYGLIKLSLSYNIVFSLNCTHPTKLFYHTKLSPSYPIHPILSSHYAVVILSHYMYMCCCVLGTQGL